MVHSELAFISELASSLQGAGRMRSWCRTMTDRQRGRGSKMLAPAWPPLTSFLYGNRARILASWEIGREQ